MDTAQEKKSYVPPLIELYTYPVEHGFAQSPKATQLETFSEITEDPVTPGQPTGENYHGEWY